MREDQSGMMASTKFSCPRCSARDAKWGYLSSMRDIGKSETWGSKNRPDMLIRIVCNECGHSWQSEEGLAQFAH